ncbi:DUF6875 domain-containing protein [Nocardia sp. NPDC058705]|uniref:DUF6875 domain-containing protein n=1 Tax=Nocardia sp. NPDC058705 TaxID=3346609 RepID=UPI00369A9C6B
MSTAQTSPFVPGSLTDVANAHTMFDEFPCYQAVLGWMANFVLQPDERLGRAGAVCPRLASAIDADLVQLVAVRTAGTSIDDAVRIGQGLADLYVELFDETTFQRGALMAIFPDLDPADAAQFIDAGHARLRPEFVRRAMMLGEFHPASTVGSVHNRDFPVMQSPVPMFAVRALTTHDALFLDQPGPDRHELLRHYLDYLGDRAPTTVLRRVQARLPKTGR